MNCWLAQTGDRSVGLQLSVFTSTGDGERYSLYLVKCYYPVNRLQDPARTIAVILLKSLSQHLLKLMSCLSLRNQYRLGSIAAFFIARMPNRITRQTRQNIDLCLGELDTAAQRQLYRGSIRHTSYAFTELAALWFWPLDRVLALITSIEICAEFDRSQRGRVILVPHLGSWEAFAIWLGHHHDAMFLYKPQKDSELDTQVHAARARSGGTPVPTNKQGLRQLLAGIRQGSSIMILPDQRARRRQAHAEATFFGFSALTTTLVHSLCSRVECDVFLGAMCRSDPVGEFSLTIRPLEHARLAANLDSSAQYMNDQIESLVRENLAQYQWSYRRFDASAYATLDEDY